MWKQLFDPARRQAAYTGTDPFLRYLDALARFLPSLWKAGMAAALSAVPLILCTNVLVRYRTYPGMILVCLVLLVLFSVPFSLCMTALTRFSCQAILNREEELRFWKTWAECIRANARQAIPIGMLFSLLLGAGVCAFRILTSEPASGSMGLLVLVLFLMLLDGILWQAARMQLVLIRLTAGQILKNSFLLLFTHPVRFLLSGVLSGAASALLYLFFPIPGAFLVLVCLPGAASLAFAAAVWPVFDRTFSVTIALSGNTEESGGAESGSAKRD